MEIVYDQLELRSYMRGAVEVLEDSPILLDRFLDQAIEVDIDAVSDGSRVVIGSVMEHIEQAGVHSGDSACSLPPYSIDEKKQTYNINGDHAAGAVAKSLKSRRLLLMTNVEGVLNREKKLISEINSSKIIEMIEDKTITEGMIPKINTCLDAVKNDVTAVGIIDGRKPRSVLFELFSDRGSGTLIRK